MGELNDPVAAIRVIYGKIDNYLDMRRGEDTILASGGKGVLVGRFFPPIDSRDGYFSRKSMC